ncbi:MAG: hypothetical protein H6818_22580 [Phycisphaerales bacterium]|nr:hypothetical protein [Phycisphaerales bacterium]
MILRVDPEIRRHLVTSRIVAMTRGPILGSAELAMARAMATSPVDKAAIGLLESEIFALDLQPREARRAFEEYVEPLLASLSPSTAALIADNKAMLLVTAMEGTGDFYHLVDVRRILGVDLRDHASVLEARSNADAGKHFNVLPIYWQQLRRSYELQNWRARRVAEELFSEECIHLGWLDEAAYHAMLSGNHAAVERSARSLLVSRSPKIVGSALKKLLGAAALREHALQAIRIIAICADAIPDDLVDDVAGLLMKHAAFQPTGWHDRGIVESTWDAIDAIAHRLDGQAVRSLTDLGIEQPILKDGGPLRSNVIDGLNALTAQTAPGDLQRLTDVALSLVTDQRNDVDYVESLNLLCRIADRGGDEIKSQVRSRLFPSGAEIRNVLLVQVGPILGWNPMKPESFTEAAVAAAKAIRKQVQRIAPGEEPTNIGGYGTYSSSGSGGQVVVYVRGAMHLIEALAPFRAIIEEATLTSLLAAMLDMIAEPENLIANRTALALSLRKFIDHFPTTLDCRAVEVLHPLASGEITEPSHLPKHAEALNPLNPFKSSGGDPVDLRGAALMLLCELDRERKNVCTLLHNQILLAAITSADAGVRRYGLIAAAGGGNLSQMEQTAIMLAGLDPDPQVAQMAIRAMTRAHGSQKMEPVLWQIAARAIEMAANSSDGGHRAAASEMLKMLSETPPELEQRLGNVREKLQHDLLYSVRKPWI